MRCCTPLYRRVTAPVRPAQNVVPRKTVQGSLPAPGLCHIEGTVFSERRPRGLSSPSMTTVKDGAAAAGVLPAAKTHARAMTTAARASAPGTLPPPCANDRCGAATAQYCCVISATCA